MTKLRIWTVILSPIMSRSFVVVQSVIDTAVPAPAGPVVSVPVARACVDLLEVLGRVSDGRSDQGRDHPVSVVLALAVDIFFQQFWRGP